jgi:hypothetical protein
VHDGNVLRFGHNPNAEREKEDVEEEGECRAGSPASRACAAAPDVVPLKLQAAAVRCS